MSTLCMSQCDPPPPLKNPGYAHEHTNHEATLPPTDVGESTLKINVLGVASRVNIV